MDRRHFEVQMKRLADTFGFKAYSDERVDLFWKKMNHLSNDWMTRTVDHFLLNLRQAPLMTEFSDEISKERERLWQIQKSNAPVLPEKIQGWFCGDCDNKGIVFQENNTICKCSCEHGQRRPENYPVLRRNGLRAVQ